MKYYPKIDSIFKRDITLPKHPFINEYSRPEFQYLRDNMWIFSEKVDGTNMVVFLNPGEEPVIGGHTATSDLPKFLVEAVKNIFRGKTVGHPITLYGEGFGAKIQKGGGNYRSTPGFALFDAICEGFWLRRNSLEDIALKLELEIVPLIGKGTLEGACDICKRGFISRWGDFPAEGLVLRPEVEMLCRNGERVITKVKLKDFRK